MNDRYLLYFTLDDVNKSSEKKEEKTEKPLSVYRMMVIVEGKYHLTYDKLIHVFAKDEHSAKLQIIKTFEAMDYNNIVVVSDVEKIDTEEGVVFE